MGTFVDIYGSQDGQLLSHGPELKRGGGGEGEEGTQWRVHTLEAERECWSQRLTMQKMQVVLFR